LVFYAQHGKLYFVRKDCNDCYFGIILEVPDLFKLRPYWFMPSVLIEKQQNDSC
jgi:hypothetical protein